MDRRHSEVHITLSGESYYSNLLHYQAKIRHAYQYLWYAYVCLRGLEFQIYNILTPPTFISAIFKDGGRRYCHRITSPRQLCLCCWIACWVSKSNVVFLTFSNITIRASCKDCICQSLIFRILINTPFTSFYHRILSASYRRRVYLMYSGELFDPLLTLVIRLRRVQRRTCYVPHCRSVYMKSYGKTINQCVICI